MELRAIILKGLYRLFPFSLQGDARLVDIENTCEISCVINFYGRIDLLEGILYSLSEQDMTRDKFEVLLVEDRNGTKDGRDIADRFGKYLQIRYSFLKEYFGVMGYSRNLGLSQAQGEYVLFLDDDTVILQKDFLSTLLKIFRSTGADAIVPHGNASYSILKEKYDYHEPYYPTSRCMAYRRDVLKELCGFVSEITGQEDVEFVIRYIASGKTYRYTDELEYYHPPLIVNKTSKAEAVGSSFARLRGRYPFLIWLMLLFNGARHFPLIFLPLNTKWKAQARFSLGFIIGIINSFKGKKSEYI